MSLVLPNNEDSPVSVLEVDRLLPPSLRETMSEGVHGQYLLTAVSTLHALLEFSPVEFHTRPSNLLPSDFGVNTLSNSYSWLLGYACVDGTCGSAAVSVLQTPHKTLWAYVGEN